MRSIRGLLFPQEGIFFELLESESKNVLKGAKLLSQMATKFDNNTNLIRKKIKNLEREGDKIVAEIHQRLNSSFITPIDHEDIANLANTYDDVIKSFAKLVLSTCQEIDKAFISMKKLSQTEMDARSDNVKKLEREADDLLDHSTADLFKKKNFVAILKYKELYEILEGTTGKCMDVVDILRGIVLKHS